ncbi:MAG: SDR family NAD(P)-dependent oxidoreductase, partial [Stackebrandtia sp.]
MLAAPAGHLLFVPGNGTKVAAHLVGTSAPAPSAEREPVLDAPAFPAGAEARQASPGPVGGSVTTDTIREALITAVASIVKIDPSRIDPAAEIGGYGFDSLSFTRLANQLSKDLKIDLTPAIFFEYTSVADLADYLAEAFPAAIATALVEPVRAVPPVAEIQQPPVRAVAPEPAMPVPSRGREREPVAIVGMHGMLPGAADLAEFWQNLDAGTDVVSEIPADRWDWREYFGDPRSGHGKTNSKWGGFLPEVDKFDAGFFGISPREAELMDPQQRLFLETVYGAVEEAGYKPSDLSSGRTGLFVGVASHDYYELLREAGVPIEAYTTTGLFHAILANRASYLLNLKGPSFPIDTACSSSLVAVRSAVEAIWSGSCDVAIVGGVNLLLAPMIYISFAQAGMLSPSGRCKTFDATADGYVRAEGTGALLLKPLSQALDDGDHIHAVIRGSAVNHGGRVNTLTTPNPNAQSDLIVQAFTDGGVDPATVGYMEMHGTGTALGDPIEVNGLKKALRELRGRAGQGSLEDSQIMIGSVKSNIGHLEAAAGMAGIFKVILAMKHGRVPKNLHVNEVNPYIQLAGSPLRIVTRTESWPRLRDEFNNEMPRRAGVSSFGFGGVNGHVLLEEHIPAPSQPSSDVEQHLFVVSARTAERLREYAVKIARFVESASTGNSSVAATAHPASDITLSRLVEKCGQILGIRPADVPMDETLEDMGFGPLRLSQLRDWIQESHDSADHVDVRHGHSLATVASALTVRAAADREQPGLILRDLAFTLQVGREPMSHRLAVVTDSAGELAAKLARYARTEECEPLVFRGTVEESTGDPVPDPAERDLCQIAERWVYGSHIDWNALYTGTRPQRLSVPTYPFARTRYWIPRADTSVTGGNTAPPVAAAGHRPARGPGSELTRRLAVTDRIVAEHRVHGRAVFPGVGHLELVRGAASGNHAGPFRMSKVVWSRPVTVVGSHQDVEVVLSGDTGRREYELRGTDNGEELTFSRGVWEALDPAAPIPPAVAVQEIRARCGTHLDRTAVYRRFRQLGINYGPLFQGIRELWIGPTDVLASVAVNELDLADHKPFTLHPTLLDAAVQAIAAFGFPESAQHRPTRLPFSLESMDVVRPLPRAGYAHVTKLDDNSYDVALVDEQGRPCAILHEVTVRQRQDPLDRFLFAPYWVPRAVAHSVPMRTAAGAPDSVVIVHAGQGSGLAKEIAKRGGHQGPSILQLAAHTRRRGEREWNVALDDPEGFAACVRQLDTIRDVWFLGGLRDLSPHEPTIEPTGTAAAGSVLTLFRFLRCLAELDRIQDVQTIRVVVNDVHDVDGRRIGNPAAAGLVGFAKSLAKEFPHIAVVCVDIGVAPGAELSETDHAELVDALLAEPAQRDNTEIAYLGGRRYVKALRPVHLPNIGASPFRNGGVYLIVGGATGIGLVLARHLATSVGARLILVGRRPESPEITAELRNLTSLGAEVIYRSGDVTDTARLEAIVAETTGRFGAIHGVVHAGMVLHDGIIERLDESTLRAVLAPKADGSRVLADLFAAATLDFMLFFSSVQSFTGSAGQSNYAAASTAQDAFGRWAAGRCGFPVKIINWGFWGTVGSVATESYRKTLAARGYHSISPDEGLAAIERVLASDERQVVVVNADDTVLAAINVQAEDEAARAGVPIATVEPLTLSAADGEERTAFDTYLALGCVKAMQDLGLFRQPGQTHRRDTLAHESRSLPKYTRILQGITRILIRHGFVAEDGGLLVTTDRVAASGADSVDVRLRRLEAELRRSFADLHARLDLAATCLASLPRVLTGSLSGPEVLFPSGSMEHVARVYRGERLADYCNKLVAEQAQAWVQGSTGPGPTNDEVHIIEIGAGTGATTRAVLETLRHTGRAVRYDFTDISARLVRDAAHDFSPVAVPMSFRELDIERTVATQGFTAGSYSLVIAANAIHAAKDLDAALAHTRELLAVGGRLVLTEVTQVLPFHTVTFGLLDGWWHHNDEMRRLDTSPLLDTEMWRRRLERAGFTAVTFLGVSTESVPLSQRVIVAEAAAGVANRAAPFTAPAPTRPEPQPPKPADAFAAPVTENGMKQRIQDLVATLTAQCLRMPVEEVKQRVALSSLGVDSIVGVELINRINDALGIVLKTIVIFDHPTVQDLTEFIVERHGEALAGRFAGTTVPEPAQPQRLLEPDPDDGGRGPVVPACPPSDAEFVAVRFERPGSPRDLRVTRIEPVAP